MGVGGETKRVVKQVNLPVYGIDLNTAPEDIGQGYALNTQNMYYRRGLQTKLGSSKHSTNQVVASTPIVGLHRFYYGNANKQLIAASGTNVSYMNDATGAWTTITTGQTSGLQTHMTTWSATSKEYISNGTDTPFSWDGTTKTNLTAFPADTIMFLPYRDRLLYIQKTNSTYLKWSGSYDDTTVTTDAQAIRFLGGGQIQVIAPHAVGDAAEGINSMIFLATSTTCALFSGTNLNPASASYDARLDHVSSMVGTLSPWTVVSTPYGTMFLGSDLQVYLIPYGSARLQPIGRNIQSTSTSVYKGIESIPLAQLGKCAAVYHKGFYKLAIPTTGGTTNTYQFWLDLERVFQDSGSPGKWGPWFGPFLGMALSCFARQDGPGDDGRLIGGDAVNGFVFRVNEPSIYTDNGTAITARYKSYPETYDDGNVDKRIQRTEIETNVVASSFKMRFFDTTGKIGDDITITSGDTGGIYWHQYYWGQQYWSSASIPVRRQINHYENGLIGRYFSTEIEYTSSTDALELYAIKHEAKRFGRVFQIQF